MSTPSVVRAHGSPSWHQMAASVATNPARWSKSIYRRELNVIWDSYLKNWGLGLWQYFDYVQLIYINLVWPTVAWPWPTHTSLHWAGWAGANLWPWRSAELQPILASSEGLHEGVHLRAAECKGHLNQLTDANKWSKNNKRVCDKEIVHIIAYSRCRSVLSPEQVEAGGTCTFLSSCLSSCLKRYDIPTVFYSSFAPKSWVINPVTPLEISRIPLKALSGRRPSGAFGVGATPGAEGQAHLASS